jgi:hypothetical protein
MDRSTFNSVQIAQSRMYLERKNEQRLTGGKAMVRAAANGLSPANLSKRKRAHAMGYLHGTLAFRMVELGKRP